jgi:hypothetical protein
MHAWVARSQQNTYFTIKIQTIITQYNYTRN